MSYQRLAYDDHDSADQMAHDCTACRHHLTRVTKTVNPVAVTMPAPSLAFDAFPRETRKPSIAVSDAAAHLASRLHLHLD